MAIDLGPVLTFLRGEIPELAGVYLFGSLAAGQARADSDVDLAIYAGRPLKRPRLIGLQQLIANALNCDVDLVDLADAPTVLQCQVIDEGKLIDAPRPEETAMFELRVIREYQDLKARRAATEADIAARGRVHA